MRTVRRNKTKMKYASFLDSVQIVQTDSKGNPEMFVDEDGEAIYMVTGEKINLLEIPEDFSANISMSGGDAVDMPYGLDFSQYDAIIIYSKDAYPIVEGTYIWVNSEVEYENLGEEMYVTHDMHDLVKVQTPKETSADYIVRKVDDSLSYTRLVVQAITK